MATIKLNYTRPSEDIEVSIGVLTMNLATREVNVRLSARGEPRSVVQVNMLPSFNALTATQKAVIKNWYKQQAALAMNVKHGTSLTYADIPDSIFDPEPKE